MSSFPQQVAKIKQCVKVWNEDDAEIERVDKLLTRGRAMTWCFSALSLLNNQQLHAKSKTGSALRGQLAAAKMMLEKNVEKYGDAVPTWLVERVTIAAEVSA